MGLTVMGHRPRRQGLWRELNLFLEFFFSRHHFLGFLSHHISLSDTRGRAGFIVLSAIGLGFSFGLVWLGQGT